MSFNDQVGRFRALEEWFNSLQGNHVGHAFSAELIPLQSYLQGEILLQLGCGGDSPWLESLRYNRKWVASPYSASSKTEVITSLHQLPLDRNSVDCVLMPLTLNAFTHQKNPIDEVDRVLKPMGYVVFFGVNPVSFWGACMRMKRFSCFGPLLGKSQSIFFIKRAMLRRGYTQCSLSSFYYLFPVRKKKWIDKLEILNELGKMIWPCPAGFYCLVMQKYQESYPPMCVNSEVSKSLATEYAQPTCYTHHE